MTPRMKGHNAILLWNTAALAAIGAVDAATGYRLGLSVFYLIPILRGTWKTDRCAGGLLAGFGAAVWALADWLARGPASAPWLLAWNSGVRLVFFLVTIFLLVEMKRERKLARRDALTDLLNRRAFFERLSSGSAARWRG